MWKINLFASAIDQVRTGSAPVFVDLAFSHEEQEILSRITIRRPAEFNCFTEIERVSTTLPRFLKVDVGVPDELSIQTATQIILDTSQCIVAAAKKETAWICVRSFLPSSEYNVARWHCDGGYYEPFDSAQLKFCAVLLGDPTLFGAVDPHDRPEFYSLLDSTTPETKRREGHHILVNKHAITKVPRFHGAFFIAGNDQLSTVHSEPPINKSRLFFSVLPGTTDEIKSLAVRWKCPI